MKNVFALFAGVLAIMTAISAYALHEDENIPMEEAYEENRKKIEVISAERVSIENETSLKEETEGKHENVVKKNVDQI